MRCSCAHSKELAHTLSTPFLSPIRTPPLVELSGSVESPEGSDPIEKQSKGPPSLNPVLGLPRVQDLLPASQPHTQSARGVWRESMSPYKTEAKAKVDAPQRGVTQKQLTEDTKPGVLRHCCKAPSSPSICPHTGKTEKRRWGGPEWTLV